MTELDPLIAELAQIGEDAVRRGLVIASGGNLSARLPDSDAFLVTNADTWLDRLGPGDFGTIGMDGSPEPAPRPPSSEWRLHWRTYQARPDVNAIVHLHPQTAVVLDALGHEVRLLTLDHAYYLSRVRRIPFLANGSEELAQAAAEASRDCNAIILAHHGCSTLGRTIAMAYRRALLLEEAARNTVLCLQLGDTATTFPPGALADLRHGAGPAE
jgi:L-fuculose-phosphate aldolase